MKKVLISLCVLFLACTVFAGGGMESGSYEGSGVPVPAPAAEAPLYNIGETGPAGGIVFYDKGDYSGGWRYLEAATADLPSTLSWNKAAAALKEYSLGDYSDWQIPSKDILDLLFKNLKSSDIGMFADEWYWSATQENEQNAWAQHFSNGGGQNLQKDHALKVRPIRAF